MKLFLFVCGFFFIFPVLGQNYRVLVKQADSLYNAGNYEESHKIYARAFVLEKENPLHLYNAACSAALAGKEKKSFELLQLACDKGWTNIHHLKTDTDLESLHGKPGWEPLVQKLQQRVDEIEKNYDKVLQQELLQILSDDQDIRSQWIKAARELGDQHPLVDSLVKIALYKDSINLAKIIRILDERGWVGKNKVGEQASQAIFLVIQHSDLQVQEKYLPMMREAVKQGNASRSSLALLEDRVALRQGRKQLYGSQVYRNQSDNTYYPAPMEDPDHVDERRAQMGLPPLTEYLIQWKITWDVETYKKKLPEYERLHREMLEENK